MVKNYNSLLIFAGMTYPETINYLFTRLPMFSRTGAAAYKKDLTNTLQLCAALDNPQQHFKSIHIAGTNGKGSVSHMLAAILQTAGYKTGLYTSPHLKDFRERIRVNGEMIQKEFVVAFTEKVKPLIEKIEPSFFEITVAMAFDYFASQRIDIAVIETGLGGRLDSTNIIIPELSVITNIGLDHTNLLGNSLEEIAAEKAGIIKPGVPVVIGETMAESKPVFEKTAAEKRAAVSFADAKRTAGHPEWEKEELRVTVTEGQQQKNEYRLDLSGIYQVKNLLTVLEAVSRLQQQGWKISEEAIRLALTQVKKLTGLHGRWDIIHRSPMVVLDVAHNTEGIAAMMEQVKLTPHQQLHIILGVVKDKEIESMLNGLPKEAVYYFTQADIPRALPGEELAKKGARFRLKGKSFSSVNMALYSAMLEAGKEDLIIVCGSIFLAGEVSIGSIREMGGKEKASIFSYDFWEMIRIFD